MCLLAHRERIPLGQLDERVQCGRLLRCTKHRRCPVLRFYNCTRNCCPRWLRERDASDKWPISWRQWDRLHLVPFKSLLTRLIQPLIEANWGDTIQVTVHNAITNPPEGTTLHWHGQRQYKNEAYDGVPSVSMCPIAPGSSYTYSFQANPWGSSW